MQNWSLLSSAYEVSWYLKCCRKVDWEWAPLKIEIIFFPSVSAWHVQCEGCWDTKAASLMILLSNSAAREIAQLRTAFGKMSVTMCNFFFFALTFLSRQKHAFSNRKKKSLLSNQKTLFVEEILAYLQSKKKKNCNKEFRVLIYSIIFIFFFQQTKKTSLFLNK